MIYFIVFAFSLASFYIAQKCKKANNKPLFYIFSVIGILIPSFLAALRDVSIGTDVELYIERWFEYATKFDNFNDYVNYIESGEKLYLFVNYSVSRFTSEISILFFVLQLLNIVPLVIALNKYDEKINVPFAMFIYFAFFYNMSFNIVRQAISLSFSLLAFVYMFKSENKKFVIFLIISILFHNSAALGIIVWFIYNNSKSKNFNLYTFIYLVVILFILVNFENSVGFLINIGIVPSRYMSYITRYLKSEVDFNIVYNLFYFSILGIMTFKIKRDNRDNKFLFNLFILGIAAFEFGMISAFANRASYILIYPGMFFLLPQLSKKEKLTKNDLLTILITIMLLVVYWFFWIVIQQVHETYPFVFA